MQNRFVGDIGDFSKYGLLRLICRTDLSLGINWYLTDDGRDTAGNKIDYLDNSSQRDGYEPCDPELFWELHKIVKVENDRNVARIEKSGLLPPEAIFYSQQLKADKNSREKWFQDSLNHLASSEIIYLDPDTNILRNLDNSYMAEGCKYVLPWEVEQYFLQGHSLIVYNHQNREPDYNERFTFLKTSPAFKGAQIFLMRFGRISVRYYLFVIQPKHLSLITTEIEDMLAGPWGKKWRYDTPHFEKIDLFDRTQELESVPPHPRDLIADMPFYNLMDGTKYKGQFRGGIRHGYGIEIRKGKYVYEGYFVDGLRHGTGTETLANGCSYEGNWHEGRKNGPGIIVYADGRIEHVNWLDDHQTNSASKKIKV